VLLERAPDVPPPSLVVVVVDASTWSANLYFATQVIELGHPTILALNMVDVAEQNGQKIDAAALGPNWGFRWWAMGGQHGSRDQALPGTYIDFAGGAGSKLSPSPSFCELPPAFEKEVGALAALLEDRSGRRRGLRPDRSAAHPADEKLLRHSDGLYPAATATRPWRPRQRLEGAGWIGAARRLRPAIGGFASIQQAVTRPAWRLGAARDPSVTALDRLVTQRFGACSSLSRSCRDVF